MSQLRLRRREFLKAVGTSGVVALGGALPGPWLRVAAAQQAAASSDRILVIVQLSGGNDGLNTVIPVGEDAYYRARPALAISKEAALGLNDRLALHPGLSGFRDLWDAGRLAVVEGIGYPQPDRSHFRSMDIWHTALPQSESTESGWIGRGLDHLANIPGDTREAACIGMERQPLACIGQKVLPPNIQRLEDFRLKHSRGKQTGIDSPNWTAAAAPNAHNDLAFLRQSARVTLESAHRLEALKPSAQRASYPQTGLGQQLKLISQLIAADLPTRVFYTALNGFDTHAQQLPGHAALMGELSGAVSAFMADLDELGLSDRVMLTTFSEFGRRVAENGSLGTDHGAASVSLSVTPPGRGGIYGAAPRFDDLDDGDLKYTTDFRRLYATLLDRWLGIPSEQILGGTFEPLGLA